MPLFITDEELERCSHNASLIADKADSFIRALQRELETVKAQSDASSITAEQTCALLEQKYLSLSSDFAELQSQNAQLSTSLEKRLSELAEAQTKKHQLHLKAISKDGDVERLSIEASEHHKSKRQLVELLEQKDIEIGEKNATIKSYLDKIVNLIEDAALKEARLHDKDAELARLRSGSARLSQEKELIAKHNLWLNEELTTKANSLIELRRTHTEFEADMSVKLVDGEKKFNDCSISLKLHKERVRELERKLTSLQEELCSTKDAAAANEEHYSAEKSTISKLVDLYKESAEEWSRKAGELEGVIKALETHLSQVETDYKEKLEKEASARKDFEKEASDLKEKLEKCELEIVNARKPDKLSLLPPSSLQSDSSAEELWISGTETVDKEDSRMLVPKVPVGVSETALAASLLRDGWSLARMYEKCQEAVDALHHEQLGRKHSQAILERVLYEIEEKAEVISDERAEHERMAEACNLTNQKLQQSLSENAYLENIIRELKVDLRRHERDHDIAQKEIIDLQKQVTVLLKECRDIQLRCGVASQDPTDSPTSSVVDMEYGTEVEKLTFKDINGLVGQNVQLRSLVHSLSIKHDQIDAELKEKFEMELQKHIDEASSKVASVLERSEEQGRMIESLHDSVAMYKRLYEEELKSRASYSHLPETFPEDGRKDLILLSEGSQQEATKKALEQAAEQVRNLEDDLAKFRSEAIALRLDCDKLAMEANFARERLDSFMKEFECQRDEMNEVLARNVEFSQLIVDYQRRLRESADSLSASEELSQKLSMEMSVLKHEKAILINSEKRASDEVHSLSERVHRLQATLDTIHSAEEVREEARAMERRKHEEYLKRVEREWAEAKKELQEEQDLVRTLTLDREETLKNAMSKGEEATKELADALRAVAASEARAAIAEARCSELEAKLISPEEKTVEDSGLERSVCSTNEVIGDLRKANEEILKVKDEAQAYKDHMLQYKEIAQVNEMSLKQIESAHERFKDEADKLKKSLEAEILSLRSMVLELESDVLSKTTEAASAVAEKEEALSSAVAEIKRLNEDNSTKIAQMVALEVQMSSLKEDLVKERQRWRTAQNNYERQVILQSETIQELTRTSQELALLQDEVSELRKLADARKSENDFLKGTWDAEKSDLQELKDGAERKYSEINDQNKILLNHIEALHIKLAEKERTSAGICSGSTYQDPQGDGDLEKVVGYLQRSKDMVETEFSLLKQEKLRLQSQLENALKASETAQDLLHSEHASSRDTLFTDEEFKSFKLQVREMNLLRESNMQLREENKHNFEECQKYREIAQKAKMEAEHLGYPLKEKQIEVDACRKEIEIKNMKIEQLEHKISEMKQNEKEAVSEEAMKLAFEKQQCISSLEQGLANSQLELTEMQKKMGDSVQNEATLKSEAEKQKKLASHFKKRVETLTKEKEELSREKQAISKQLEDARSSKKPTGEAANEQAMKEKEKEKDTRLQMLEKTLEREREDLQKEKEDHQKEKSKRQKIEKMVLDLMQSVHQEKKKILEELDSHKHARDSMLETSGITSAQLPSETGLDDQTAAYLLAVDNFDEAMNSVLNGLGVHPVPSETSLPADASLLATGQQVPDQTLTTLPPSMVPLENSSQVKITEERKKRANMPKSNVDARKVGRKLVRPRLERMQEPTADTDASGMEGSSTSDAKSEASDAVPQGELTLPPSQLARKRLASSSASELREESLSQQVAISDIAPLLKKSKGSDLPQEGTKEQSNLLASENPEKPLEDLEDSAGYDLVHATNESVVVTKEIKKVKEPTDEPKEPLDGMNEDGLHNECTASLEEFNEKPKETADELDAFLKVEEVPEPQKSTAEAENERVDGELIPDGKLQEGSGPLIIGMDLEPGECLAETVTGATVDVSDAIEIGSPEVLNQDKNEIGEVMEEIAEGSDKSNNYNDNSALESQRSPQASFGAGEGLPNLLGDSVVSKQASPSLMTESEEGKELQGRRSTTTIDIRERARARAALRQAGVVSPPLARGRGRTFGSIKKDGGRGGQAGRGGRGQSSGDKEQG